MTHPTPTQEPNHKEVIDRLKASKGAPVHLVHECKKEDVQEPIEKNILNDPNGTVDKMQKELEQQAKAHQPSEGWDEKLEYKSFNIPTRSGDIITVIHLETAKEVVADFLTTARREERRTIAADITKILHSKEPSVFLQKYIDEELLAPPTSPPTPRN